MLVTILVYIFGATSLLSVALFLLYTLYLFYVHHKYSHFPMPKMSSFYLGHVADMIRLRKESGNPELSITEVSKYWFQEAGSETIVVFFFHDPKILIVDPDVIKTVVMNVENGKSKSIVRALGVLYGKRFLGNGILTVLDHGSWRPKRKVYDPAFNKSYLKGLVPRFNSLVDKCLNELKPLADGKTTVYMAAHIRGFVLGIVSEIVFGTDFSKIWDAKSLKLTLPPKHSNPFSYIVTKTLKGANNAFITIYPPLMHLYRPLEARDYRQAIDVMRLIGRDCIEKRIKAIKNGEETPDDILTHILQSASLKETHDMEDLLDDFCTFYVAGYETTSNLLQFTVVLVHQHPEILTRLQEEISEVLGDKPEVTVEDLEKLVYTEQVLMESLHMYHIVPGIEKELHSDLMMGDKRCPAKTSVMMEAKILLSRLLQTYSITLPDDYKLVPVQKLTLQLNDDLPCTIQILPKD